MATMLQEAQCHSGCTVGDMPNDAAILHHRNSMAILLVAVFYLNNQFLSDDRSPDRFVYVVASNHTHFLVPVAALSCHVIYL